MSSGFEEGSYDGSYVAATEGGALTCRWLLTGSVSDGSRGCRGARLDGSESNTTEGFYQRGSSDELLLIDQVNETRETRVVSKVSKEG